MACGEALALRDDGGSTDAGLSDAGLSDAGLSDAGLSDAGLTDAGLTDAGLSDAGLSDAGLSDAGLTDAGRTDAGRTDAGRTDAGLSQDAGARPDAGVLDGGGPSDAGPPMGLDAGPLAANFYVSPSGSDANPGTFTSPFATLARAHGLADAGALIYLRGGTYVLDAGIRLTRGGRPGQPIRIFAYPGERPVLDARAMTQTGYNDGWPLWMSSASWNHLKGLEIRNGPMGGLIIDGASNDNVIEGLDVHHSGRLSMWEGKGIVLAGTSANNLLLDNDSHHNVDLGRSNADGFLVSARGPGNVLRGNRAWNNCDDGYDFFNTLDGTVTASVVVEGNWAWRNGVDDAQQRCGDGNGFKLGGQRNASTSSGGHLVRDNVAWSNLAIGFDENAARLPLTLHHNTSVRNGTYDYALYTVAHTLHNNLAFGAPSPVLVTAGSTANNNSWTLPVTVSTADFVSLDDSAAAGPRPASGGLPVSPFLRLAAGSDLIDRGVPLGRPYVGAAPDLGAYEHQP